MKAVYRYSLRLVLQGPVLTGSTDPLGFGVDAPFARQSSDVLCFPGTLIKGKLLQAWKGLSGWSPDIPDESKLEQWFGKQGGEKAEDPGDFEPMRGRVRIADLIADAPKARPLRCRIKIDEELGSADEGMLEMIESPYLSGEEAVFTGTAQIYAADATEASQFARAVRIGLLAVPSFGAERSIGFGRVVGAELTEMPRAEYRSDSPVVVAAKATYGLVLQTEEPFCLAERQPATNLFRGSDIISGAAVKGVVAGMMGRLGADNFPALERNLSRVRFRHARPVRLHEPLRIPAAVPLSIVQVSSGPDLPSYLADAALSSEAPALGGKWIAFQPDWKGDDFERVGALGVEHPPRELRIRTRIDGERRRAQDENLFAYESVRPKGYRWLTNVDLRHIQEADRANVVEDLRRLLAYGLDGVGKTKALFSAHLVDPIPGRCPVNSDPVDGKVVVQLNTPALLGSAAQWQITRTAAQLHQLYRDVWATLSSNSLKLEHFFAQQDFAGGYYQYRRFIKTSHYQPWVLTKAGSVFVLRVVDVAKAKTFLDNCLLTGLPLQAPGENPFELWRKCPYVPENGFGEIAVNLQHGIAALENPHA